MDDGKILNFSPKKSCTSVGGEVDRLSALPDDILVVILSLLPLRKARATSVLSSRWSDLWKYTTNLGFYTSIKSNEIDMLGLVDSTLKSHKALCLKRFTICFHVRRESQCFLTKWLEFVLSRQVENLDLNFQKISNQRCMVMVFLEESLRESGAMCRKPQTLIFFKSLKSLCLGSLIVIGEDIELFLCNCPLLARLVIRSASLRSDVEITSLVLNELSIVNCIGRGLIKVCAPNLTSLGCDNRSGKLMLENNNMPKLVEVDFSNRTQPKHYVQHFASQLSCCTSQLRILTLTINRPKEFFANKFPEMPSLKKLVISYCEPTQLHLLRVTDLISACPGLQQLELKFTQLFEPFPNKDVVEDVKGSPHQHLKVFKFEGFEGSIDYHMQLVSYVLSSCDALEKISLICYPITNKCKTKRNYVRQQFQGKVPDHVKLQVF